MSGWFKANMSWTMFFFSLLLGTERELLEWWEGCIMKRNCWSILSKLKVQYPNICKKEKNTIQMNGFNVERQNPWSLYTSANPTPPRAAADREEAWKHAGSSTNAISFGIVATIILISLFLIMAFFEHLLRPRLSFLSSRNPDGELPESRPGQNHLLHKLGELQKIANSRWKDFSVLMPGQHYPTFIAQPAPLPCPREGMSRPSHPPATAAHSV